MRVVFEQWRQICSVIPETFAARRSEQHENKPVRGCTEHQCCYGRPHEAMGTILGMKHANLVRTAGALLVLSLMTGCASQASQGAKIIDESLRSSVTVTLEGISRNGQAAYASDPSMSDEATADAAMEDLWDGAVLTDEEGASIRAAVTSGATTCEGTITFASGQADISEVTCTTAGE